MITVTQESINSRSVSIKVTPENVALGFSLQSKQYRDEAEVFKDTCVAVQVALQDLINDLDKVLEVQAELPEILELHSKLTELLAIFNKLSTLDSVYVSLTEIEAVSAKLVEITTLYTNIASIQNVNDNIASIVTVASDITVINSIYDNLTKIDTLYTNILAIISLYTNIGVLQTLNSNITELQGIYTELTKLVSVYTNLASILAVEAKLTEISAVYAKLTQITAIYNSLTQLQTLYTNLSALLNVEADLTNINIVATDIAKVIIAANNIDNINTNAVNIQAIIDAPAFAQLAEDYANKAEDSEVETGKYSALHWAAKSEGFAYDSEIAKVASQTAQGLSEDARDLSEKWAEEEEDIEVTTGKYSAKHYSLKSEDYKNSAADSAIEAQNLANSISLGGIFYDETEALRLRVIADGGTFIKPMRLVDPEMDAYQGINTPVLANMAAYKAGKLYSIRPADGSSDFTCIRATTPTRINQLGIEEIVPINTPVIDWSTGSPLLIVTVEGELTLTTPASATKIVITIDGEDVEYNNVFPTLSLPVGSITKVIATVGGTEYDLLKAYLLRVDTASGTINEQGARDLKTMYEFLDDEGLLANTELLYLANAGMIQRTDGVLKYVRTAFDASDNDNDLNGSATASQQPRLVGGIAPNSKPAAANLNGEARYFTHPEISFAAGDAWSLSIIYNYNWGGMFLHYNGTLANRIFLQSTAANKSIGLTPSIGSNVILNENNDSFKTFSKNNIVTIVYDTLFYKLYRNGNLEYTVTNPIGEGGFVFGALGGTTALNNYNGSISAYLIQSGALTLPQVSDLHTTLRDLYPEIESVDIGTQTWASRNFEAVATPLGNVIANVTENGAVEKVTQPINISTGWAVVNAVINDINTFTTSGGYGGVYRTGVMTIGKWYKITANVSTNASGLRITVTITGESIIESVGNMDTIIYWKATQNGLVIYNTSAGVTDINTLSIQELNWSNATEIYDAVYAATSGTAAQKEYAALKEAAMWRYPNNDVNKGAWAGKLYNKYAKRLLALDMLSTNFGYNLPSESEVDELLAQVGGDTNKLKYTGLDYWNDALGTNETGLTLLGTGVMTPEGVYVGEKELTGFWTSDSDELPTTGLPIRLIKDV